ncbi:MAG: hypothetical protein MI685_12115 [Chlorobiales bacterium]|nr:hypothetical protein [Chlorobiales bacterium]
MSPTEHIKNELSRAEVLKQEIELVFQKIQHFDDLRQRTKNLTLTLWSGAVGAALAFEMPSLLFLSAVVPLPFWYFEANYHAYQEGFASRLNCIEVYLRTGKWLRSRRKGGPKSISPTAEKPFPIPDYWGNQTLEKAEHRHETNRWRNAVKWKTLIFFPVLSATSFLIYFIHA